MPLVTELFAFVAVADGDEPDDEGIMAFRTEDGTMMPMIGADMTRVEQLKPIAKVIAKHRGCSYKILTFALSGERTKE
jgi:hypothetical protein